MKKVISTILTVVMMISIAGCSTSTKVVGLDKAKQLTREESYDDAIKELETLLDADEFNLEAWDMIAEAYIKAGQFEQADEWLEQYLEMIDDNIDNKDFDVSKAIDSVGDLARDILREGEEVSSWYKDVKPAAIEVEGLDDLYEMGTILEFDVPSGSQLFYEIDGYSVKSDGIEYINGIDLSEVGYYNIDLIVKNEYGEYSPRSSFFVEVYDPDMSMDDDGLGDGDLVEAGSLELVLPSFDLAPGSYSEYIELSVSNYDTDHPDLSVFYTTDGSDPSDYMNLSVRGYYGYVPLSAGQYNIAIVAYDNTIDTYSDIAYYDYYIDIQDSIKLGLYMLPDETVRTYHQIFDEAGAYGMFVEIDVYEDLTDLDFSSLPDGLITYGTYAEDLAAYGMVADINTVINLSEYDYIGNAPAIGAIGGVNYMAPLTIRPEYMVYGGYEGVGLVNWEYIQGESEWYENRFMFAADNPEFFLGIYYGLGGPIVDTSGDMLSLDKNKLIEALTMIQSMPSADIGSKLFTLDEVGDAIEANGAEYFVYGDSIERNPDYYYEQVGPMPLSNGEMASYYNVATGLFVSKLALAMDPNMKSKMQEVYEFLTSNNYYMPSIMVAEGSIPANHSQAEEYEFYLTLSLDEYIDIIENGVSEIRAYDLYTLYAALKEPLDDFVNGATPEKVAESMIQNIANSGN
jgi:tetratricopeptide (TPR) repeat protein